MYSQTNTNKNFYGIFKEKTKNKKLVAQSIVKKLKKKKIVE